jgi:hypothetical protein
MYYIESVHLQANSFVVEPLSKFVLEKIKKKRRKCNKLVCIYTADFIHKLKKLKMIPLPLQEGKLQLK